MEAHAEDYKGLKIRIDYDGGPIDTPDDTGDDSLFLVHYHMQFEVHNENISKEVLAAWYRGEENAELKAIEKRWKIYPVAAYIHSGVVLALGDGRSFPDYRWDVSHVGAVLVEKKTYKTPAKMRAAAESLVREWNYHLSGEVYGYVIEDDDGNHLDSCWGYVGEMGDCLSEARRAADHIAAGIADADRMVQTGFAL